MDPLEAHERRLPPFDDRWAPEPSTRPQLLEGLLDGGVAGTATHPLDNVRGNILAMLEGDPDKQFGLEGLARGMNLERVLGLVAEAAGAPIDPDARYGPVEIAPEPVLASCEAAGERLRRAGDAGEQVVLATGHPVGLALLYRATGRWLAEAGAKVVTPADGVRWTDPWFHHDWELRAWGGVMVVTDEHDPRHTHAPDAMRRILAEATPDLVLADHGFAGAAIQEGVETISIADVNDPALIVARAQGRTEHVVVMDDHVDPAAYWPCFRAFAAAPTG